MGVEKVIKGLECCAKGDCADCDNCTYHGIQTDVPCESTLMRDAIALLKAQEPIQLLKKYKAHNGAVLHANCPRCKVLLDSYYNPNYCGACGRAVKWE